MDQNSDPLDEQKLASGSGWEQHVFTLTPAVGEEISEVIVTYQENSTDDEGRFTVYIDDIQLTNTYPGNDLEWYPEIFATGNDTLHTDGDCNFDMTFTAPDLHPGDDQGLFRWIFLDVDGNGDYSGGSCCECLDDDTVYIDPWPGPGIRMEIPTNVVSIDNSTNISWWQYDRAHSMLLGALLQESDGDENWLYWAWNADNHWDMTGFVHMGDSGHTKNYNAWEGPFVRNIVDDYKAEYNNVEPAKLLSLRVNHFCRSDWEGDHGGVIGDLYLGGDDGPIIDTCPPPDDIPDPPQFADVSLSSSGKLLTIGDWGVIRDPSSGIKNLTIAWGVGAQTDPSGSNLYLSRDGGSTYEYQIAENVTMGSTQPMDTIIIDDTLETVRYLKRGSYTWQVGAPPTGEGQIKLEVVNSDSSIDVAYTPQFQIHIPSAITEPLPGNTYMTAVDPSSGEVHLVWTTWGSTDTTERHILYTSSTDNVKWDTLCSPGEGEFPVIALASDGTPVVLCITNDGSSDDIVVSEKVSGNDWDTPYSIAPTLQGVYPNYAVNYVMDDDDTMHFGVLISYDSLGTTITKATYGKLKYPPENQYTPGSQLGSYVGEFERGYAPAIVLDKDDLPHITYRVGSYVYYSHYTGSSWVSDSFPSDTTCHPSIACSDHNVYILYRNPDKELVRKLGYLDGTLNDDQIIPATTGDIIDSRLVGGNVVVFTDISDADNRKVRFSQYDSETGGFSYPVPITDVMRDAYSAQGMVFNDDSLWLMWTEDRSTHNKIAYQILEPMYEIPICELHGGCASTPYTGFRNDTATVEGYSLDVGTDSVTYSFTGLESSDRTFMMEFFFSDTTDTSEQTTNYVIYSAISTDTVTIEEGYPNQFFLGDSTATTSATITVKPLGSIQVGLTRMVLLEEYSSGGLYAPGIMEDIQILPTRFALYQNAPNPFTSSTSISYAIPYACNVKLAVYDVSGRKVSKIHDGVQQPGIHNIQWKGLDDQGRDLASGIYFIRMEVKSEDFETSRKMVYIR